MVNKKLKVTEMHILKLVPKEFNIRTDDRLLLILDAELTKILCKNDRIAISLDETIN